MLVIIAQNQGYIHLIEKFGTIFCPYFTVKRWSEGCSPVMRSFFKQRERGENLLDLSSVCWARSKNVV